MLIIERLLGNLNKRRKITVEPAYAWIASTNQTFKSPLCKCISTLTRSYVFNVSQARMQIFILFPRLWLSLPLTHLLPRVHTSTRHILDKQSTRQINKRYTTNLSQVCHISTWELLWMYIAHSKLDTWRTSLLRGDITVTRPRHSRLYSLVLSESYSHLHVTRIHRVTCSSFHLGRIPLTVIRATTVSTPSPSWWHPLPFSFSCLIFLGHWRMTHISLYRSSRGLMNYASNVHTGL